MKACTRVEIGLGWNKGLSSFGPGEIFSRLFKNEGAIKDKIHWHSSPNESLMQITLNLFRSFLFGIVLLKSILWMILKLMKILSKSISGTPDSFLWLISYN